MATVTDCPEPPGHLSARSIRLWRSVAERYEFEDEELTTLSLALDALDTADTARRRLEKDGQLIADRFEQLKPHPSVQIQRDAMATWARLIGLLGIPADVADDRPKRDRRGRFNGEGV